MSKDNFQEVYNADSLKLFGLQTEFTMCHIPFIVVDDVFGALALEGHSGTGKTTLIKRIGKLNELATGGKVAVYSADKARYEDFVGCPIPNPDSMLMTVYPMPNSVCQMETLLIDEINRASYDNQEKWLSLIASRDVDGFRTKCKYIFTAMNPILVENNEVYEGVQPLDRALGERMMGIISMPAFHQLSMESRLQIMRESFNQVSWVPSDSLVEAHATFLERARNCYEDLKSKAIVALSDYVDCVQNDLHKETRGAVSIEARRAQFIITNSLAVCAINRVYNNINTEMSVLNALLLSFPNRLWEQPIEKESLRLLHTKHAGILKQIDSNSTDYVHKLSLERSLEEITEFVKTSPSKEQISKLIHQNLPDKRLDGLNHYIYASGAVLGLTMSELGSGSAKKQQNVMKEQEFSRLVSIHKEVCDSASFADIEAARDYYKKNKKFPSTFKLPNFINSSLEEDTKSFADILTDLAEIGVITISIINMVDAELDTLTDLFVVIERFLNTINSFKEVAESFGD